MGKSFMAYMELALAAIAAVGTLQHLIGGPSPITGAQIVTTIQPVLWGIQGVFPKINISMDLVQTIADGAAQAINAKFHKSAPPLIRQ